MLPSTIPFKYSSLPLNFSGLIGLSLSFTKQVLVPKARTVLTCFCYSPAANFKYDVCRDALINRVPWSEFPQVGFLPTEFHKFRIYAELMHADDRAYDLVTSEGIGVEGLDEICRSKISFPVCYAVKVYLMNNQELVRGYRGMQPFGGPVKAAYNELVSEEHRVSGTPTYQDHLSLRDVCNKLADIIGITPCTANNLLYLRGIEMRTYGTESEE